MSLTSAEFTFVTELLRQRSSIDLQPGKEYLVESRLAPIARQWGDPSVNALVGRLRGGDAELGDAVVDALTTNETSWFRDLHPFEAFTATMLPEVAAALASGGLGSTITVWSAGCSSGQEAYSLAMLLLGWLPAREGLKARIIGTDISPTMLQRARAGRFSQLEVDRGLPAGHLEAYFDAEGAQWQLRPQVRALTEFRLGNLALPPAGMPACDIVFLRNVLIYFDLTTKRAVLQNVRRVLRPGGFLVLGGAESSLSLDAAFQRIELDSCAVFRHRAEGS